MQYNYTTREHNLALEGKGHEFTLGHTELACLGIRDLDLRERSGLEREI